MGELFESHAAQFRRWTFPVCVIWGAADPYIKIDFAPKQRDFFPHAELHVFDDSGHWPHADNPERFAQVLVPFLRRARGG
jgi:pimeloyl-ACP methyl ester carboxylesterase